MHGVDCRAPARGRLALAVLLVLSGCGESAPLKRAGISGLSPSSEWKPVARTTYSVPGRALAAWSGPNNASFVVYETLPGPKTEAATLEKELLVRLENLPGLTVHDHRIREIGGSKAAWVDLTVPGFGDTMAPSGLGKAVATEGRALIPTRRLVAAVATPSRNLWFLWHSAEGEAGNLLKQAEAMLATMQITEERPAAY
jgi:hypothetical protein